MQIFTIKGQGQGHHISKKTLALTSFNYCYT